MNPIVRRSSTGLGAIVSAVACLALAAASGPAGQPTGASAKAKDGAAASRPAKSTRPLTETELAKLLDKLEKELGTLRTLSTDFRQEKHLSMFSDIVKAEGICLFRRPDTVRFELTKPFHSVMIAKGKAVAKFERIDGRWRKLKLGNPDVIRMVTGQIASWLQGRFRAKSDIYKISAVVGRRTTLILTPRKKGLREYITAIELGLTDDRKRIASVTIREAEGDFTVMRFTAERRDVVLPDRVFDATGEAPTPLPARKELPTSRPAAGHSETPTSRPRTVTPRDRDAKGQRSPGPAHGRSPSVADTSPRQKKV